MPAPRSLRAALPAALLAVAVVAAPTAAATAAATAAPTAATTAPSATTARSVPGTLTPLRVGQAPARPTYVAEATAGKVARAQFVVTYHGFSAAAQVSFQRAVDYWSTQVTSAVPITVDATYTALGPGVLGSAGPGSLWRDFTGAPRAGTWYIDAVANKRSGTQLSANPDIVANFSSAFSNWSFAAGAAPAGTYDFQSVVTHELGHGLGFLGAGTVSGGSGSVRLSGFPTAYDRFTEIGSGKKLLSYPDGSAQLASALQGNSVVFDTTRVRQANGGAPARLSAPATWRQGSSYSHLDEATYAAGRPDSLMTPALGSGETIRSQGPVTAAVFKAVGW